MASGTADTGLGVLAAARALELEFVPLLTERYDLVIPREHYESDVLRPVLTVLAGPVFARAVVGLGGYDVGEMGKIVAEVEG